MPRRLNAGRGTAERLAAVSANDKARVERAAVIERDGDRLVGGRNGCHRLFDASKRRQCRRALVQRGDQMPVLDIVPERL